MFDTMTFTKITASVCGALLILLLGKWAAQEVYFSHGYHEQSYVIDTGAQEVEEVVEVSFAEVFAVADAGKGERAYRKCSACHKLEAGENGAGPYLYAIVGRTKAAADGFSYSSTLAGMEGEWTPDALNEFIANPRGYAPGTSMSFAGIRDIEERANLIAYLQTIGG